VKEVDAVVGGWTDPRGSRQYFGSLLVGLYEKSALRFIGGVGTGFPNALERELYEKLRQIPDKKCTFTPIPQTRERAHWVQPKLVARVGYAGVDFRPAPAAAQISWPAAGSRSA